MPRQLHKLNLDIVLPVEMEVDDIVELFEQSFDVWLAETFNGAVVGVDLESDLEEFQMWYDINSDQLKHRISTKLGVQVAYPEYIVSNGL